MDNLLPSWDSVAGDQIWDSLEKQGVTIMLKEKVDLPAPETWTNRPVFKLGYGTIVSPDLTLIATGRKPNVEELGMESIGVANVRIRPGEREAADSAAKRLRNWRCKWSRIA